MRGTMSSLSSLSLLSSEEVDTDSSSMSSSLKGSLEDLVRQAWLESSEDLVDLELLELSLRVWFLYACDLLDLPFLSSTLLLYSSKADDNLAVIK